MVPSMTTVLGDYGWSLVQRPFWTWDKMDWEALDRQGMFWDTTQAKQGLSVRHWGVVCVCGCGWECSFCLDFPLMVIRSILQLHLKIGNSINGWGNSHININNINHFVLQWLSINSSDWQIQLFLQDPMVTGTFDCWIIEDHDTNSH